jgi:hypothetical protein
MLENYRPLVCKTVEAIRLSGRICCIGSICTIETRLSIMQGDFMVILLSAVSNYRPKPLPTYPMSSFQRQVEEETLLKRLTRLETIPSCHILIALCCLDVGALPRLVMPMTAIRITWLTPWGSGGPRDEVLEYSYSSDWFILDFRWWVDFSQRSTCLACSHSSDYVFLRDSK